MRLHRLRLTAFGSFPGEEEVDFDALGEAGLFLVHGPTGAGKTTVLDAVCFALYGQVPGQRNSARRLRCDHAPADRGPKVVLDVTLRGRRLRITRSPAWQRPKLRGAGLVEEKTKVLLEEVLPSGERVFLSSRADETGELVGGLLGMNADQFCQVAMLPQGDFARFLRADGDERRKLLEKLFSVKIYSDVERWLADHRTTTGQERQELRQHVDSVVDQMRGAAGPALLASLTPLPAATSTPAAVMTSAGAGDGPAATADVPAAVGTGFRSQIVEGTSGPAAVPGMPVVPDPREEPQEWAGVVLAASAEALAAEERALTRSETVLRSARAELETARELAQRQRTHTEAAARRDDLDRTADERADIEAILADAARAEAVLPLVHQAEQRAEAAAKAEGLAADALARALPVAGQADQPGPDRLAELERLRRDEIARLGQLRSEETRLAGLRERLAASGIRLAVLARQEAETAERLAALPELRKRTGERLAGARLAASALPGARAAVAEATRDLTAVRRRETLAGEAAAALRDLWHATAALPDPLLADIGLPAAAAQEDATTEPGMPAARTFEGETPPAAWPALDAPEGTAELKARVREVRDRLETLERAHRDELAVLEQRLGDEDRLGETRDELAALAARLTSLAEREAALAGAVAELPALVQEARDALRQARDQAALIPAAEAACQAAAAVLEQAQRRDALAAGLAAAESERRRATDEAQELRDHLQAIRQARIDGMAAELAGGLMPGEPCVVCGSAEHPAPASAASSTPALEDEQAAQARSDAAQEARRAAEGMVAGLSVQLDDATARAQGLTVQEARVQHDQTAAEQARLREAAERVPELEDRAGRLEGEFETATSRARELELDLVRHRADQVALEQRLAELTELLEAVRAGDATVAGRLHRITAEAGLLAGAVQAAVRAGDAIAAHAEARAAAPRRPSRSGLASAASGDDQRAIARARLGLPEVQLPSVPKQAPGGAGTAGREAGGGFFPDLEPGAAADAQEMSVAQAEEALREAEAELARLRELADGEAALVEAATRVEAELTELGETATRVGLEIAAERAAESGLAADAERLAARLDEARGEDATLAARLDRLADEAELLRDAAKAARDARAEAAERDAALAGADRVATDAGFAGLAEVRAATRPRADRETMTERLRALDAERAAVTRLLADPALTAAAALPAPDLPALAEHFDLAEREHTARASARDQAATRHDRLRALAETLESALAQWRPAEERHRLARRLAELAVGTSADNRFDMRLSSYVLGERLRQVVDAANHRLDHMSDGRYSLLYDVRKSAADRKRSGGGLGLRVLDGWTGAGRDPVTLSGGEAFMTSLALALALADVVTAEAGGVELGTLFIDEGFGTLDDDTLDGVLDILDELRDGGRAVGIVSHVGELRARVPAQLKVTKHRFGSTLATTVPT
ncbi:hypothetical protein Sme01_09890 [Sphaerisporangium melleum]|uniref:Nuclease SbcCD subunit C n=1 Tax=Sphaerisporangium melleum TaxID=321316 RepID=A0A917QU05_9ACTN|nr:AAA family ATPase [Sphaerisporangium melleum]GGK67078.1 hypothetical protein GCM10007964_07720 [Sphaerisporangium melleum]GII68513.1 hypothetical protein Sme01_09890 [Sphaerisporangium melleum]